MAKFNSEEYYPTPETLLDKITAGLKWDYIESILEPSAGSGNIVAYLMEQCKRKTYRSRELDVDCIEKDKDLAASLKGKGYKVVHDDFLTFNTFKKYSLIVMNPPFSNGATHLLKALDMQKDGGSVICILNAETLKNPCTNERKVLVQKLKDLDAQIEYLQGEFKTAERPTGVEIAVIKVYVEEKSFDSYIYENLRQKKYAENKSQKLTELAPNDYIEAAVAMYNLEVESGVKLIQEYRAMCPYILEDLGDKAYNKPILELTLQGKELSTNRFVKKVRKKYWSALFNNPKFTGNMTSNLRNEYSKQVNELSNYDFSLYNIRCIQIEMSKNLIQGIEDCIVALFDELSHQYSWSNEFSNNIHYYNGWKTNKAWIINKKVILPYMNAFSNYNGEFQPDYSLKQKLYDIEKALNYLDNGRTDGRNLEMFLEEARKNGQTKKIELKYFYVTFYKKGTCHIEFKDEELLKKLNIFGSQQKGWLPPGYGKKKYKEFEEDERKVVDEFEGGEFSYEKTLKEADFFIYNPQNSIVGIEMSA